MSGVGTDQTVIAPPEISRPLHVTQSSRNILYQWSVKEERRLERRQFPDTRVDFKIIMSATLKKQT
jgi:hypothetical protein